MIYLLWKWSHIKFIVWLHLLLKKLLSIIKSLWKLNYNLYIAAAPLIFWCHSILFCRFFCDIGEFQPGNWMQRMKSPESNNFKLTWSSCVLYALEIERRVNVFGMTVSHVMPHVVHQAFEFNSKKTMYIWSNLMDETNLWMCYSVWILRRFNVKRWIGIIILKWFLEPFCSLDFQQCHIFSEAPELETNEDFRRCRSEHFPNAHISHNSQQCGSIVSSKCGTHFNLATICNLYDNVHFDVELAVNTCKTITATISKCAGKTFRFPLQYEPTSSSSSLAMYC